MEYPHHHIVGISRIGQRAEDIENRPDAKLFTHSLGMFHRRMVIRRIHEADTDIIDRLGYLFRRQVDIDV